jgi:hypothetical protein
MPASHSIPTRIADKGKTREGEKKKNRKNVGFAKTDQSLQTHSVASNSSEAQLQRAHPLTLSKRRFS